MESCEAKAEQKKRKEKRKAIGPNHFSSIWRNEYAPNVSNTLFPVIHSFIRLSTVRKPVLLLLLFKRIKWDTLTLRKQENLPGLSMINTNQANIFNTVMFFHNPKCQGILVGRNDKNVKIDGAVFLPHIVNSLADTGCL